MDRADIVAHIDAEIVRLKKARAILAGVASTERLAAAATNAPKLAKRGMSAASRAKIAQGQKERWAEIRKTKKAA
ncbi:MAG: hypothetical protein BGO25_02625 [Acidobacteriales bacterium 59-55]|nr:hypothetical protein [Terriglobales bacterium]OJV42414.1 MAG: hypothetical protein BGO25_02625 [Acidobacteriales bacterium 59-55]